ncbi:MAG TPA: S8 family serine peptidase [Steroidobacteraceae bacterium]|nr:S8 family serine peptidase [Steroidobacteraceae bacterium]
MVPSRPSGLHPASAPGHARLYAVGTRSAEQRQRASKLDSILADLTRHATLARPGHVLADLHSLSPAARFRQSSPQGAPLVLVDATTRGDAQQLKAALTALGLEHAAVFANDVGGWLPIAQLESAAERSEVVSIRAAMPHARTGAVSSQGDYVELSRDIRLDYPAITGAGVTVGVLSDSFNCYAAYAAPGSGVPVSGYEGYAPNGFTADYATDISTGDLPASVNVLEEADCLDYGAPTQSPFSDEGRAMLQIVYDVAPGASLAFYTAENSEADFAAGIGKLAAAGAKVIADDVGYFDEPFFQDGILAQAVDAVEAQGVAYFSAAGNDSDLSYENTAPSFATVSSSGPNQGEHLLNFDRTGATVTTTLPVTVPPIPPGDFLAVVVEWDQPYVTGAPGSPGASSSVDLCVTGATGSVTITDYDGHAVSCTGPNAVGVDPYQIMIIGNPANATGNSAQQSLSIVVGVASNANGTPLPGRIIVSVEDGGLGSTIDAFATDSATIQGHPGAAGAAAVGAAFYFDTPACGTTPATLESFSSIGGAPILFDTSGARLATPLVRQKPDFVGPDGVNDTFLGFTLASAGYTGSNGLLNTTNSACQNDPSYPNFFGTSAATPHAAGVAALELTANPAATPTQLYDSLRASALPMGGATPNFRSGYGFIQAYYALVVPTLTLASSSIALGKSTTLSWSTVYATSCVASGNWSGTQAASGSVVVTPGAAGTDTYTLACRNASGVPAAASTTLTVTSGTPPTAPALTLTANSVPVGESTTLRWSSTDATSCAASGSWSGTLPTSGSQAIAPTAVGTETFTLTCSNLGGPSAPTSVTLLATPAAVVPPAPTLTLGAKSIPAETTTTISWSSPTASSCTASGNAAALQTGWSGTLAPSGTFTVTPLALGTDTYTLYCTNGAGNSPTTSVNLTVTASTDVGGGGAFDALALAALAALLLARSFPGRRPL